MPWPQIHSFVANSVLDGDIADWGFGFGGTRLAVPTDYAGASVELLNWNGSAWVNSGEKVPLTTTYGACAFDRYGVLLAVGDGGFSSFTGQVRIYDTSTGVPSLVQTISAPVGHTEFGGDSVGLSANGLILAVSSRSSTGSARRLRIYDRSGGTFTFVQEIIPGGSSTFDGLALNADGTLLVSSSSGFDVLYHTGGPSSFTAGTLPSWPEVGVGNATRYGLDAAGTTIAYYHEYFSPADHKLRFRTGAFGVWDTIDTEYSFGASASQLGVVIAGTTAVFGHYETSTGDVSFYTYGTAPVPFTPDWLPAAMPASSSLWKAVAYNGSVYAAVANSSSTGTWAMSSADGQTWTARVATNHGWNDVIYAPELGLFVAVGTGTTTADLNNVMTSPDGITWTLRTVPVYGSWQKVAWDGTRLVAVGADAAAAQCITSPDGITWTQRTISAGVWPQEIAHNGTVFAAMGVHAASSEYRCVTSPDGITWTPQSIPNVFWSALGGRPGQFVALSFSGDQVLTSADGVSWAAASTSLSAEWGAQSMHWTGTEWIVSGNGFGATAPAPLLASSPDGGTWTYETAPLGYGTMYGLAGGSLAVGVGLRSSTFNDGGAIYRTSGAPPADVVPHGGTPNPWGGYATPSSISIPSSLPVPMRDGYGDTVENTRSAMQPERGHKKRRRKYATEPRLFNVSWMFTAAEFATFDTWYKDTLMSGVRSFDLRLLDDDATLVWYTVHFTPDGYELEVDRAYNFKVTARVYAISPSFADRPAGTDDLNGLSDIEFSNIATLRVGVALTGISELSFDSVGRLIDGQLFGVSDMEFSNLARFGPFGLLTGQSDIEFDNDAQF